LGPAFFSFLGIFVFHPLMGLLAVFGAVVLLIVALLNQHSLANHSG
jgi:ABC-type protease/lipase transport system fused ATPase/permease subunit